MVSRRSPWPGFFFFQAEDGIRYYKVTGVQSVLFRSSPRRRAPRPVGATFHRAGHKSTREHRRSPRDETDGRQPARQTHAESSRRVRWVRGWTIADRKSTRLNSSHLVISYAVFCLKKK